MNRRNIKVFQSIRPSPGSMADRHPNCSLSPRQTGLWNLPCSRHSIAEAAKEGARLGQGARHISILRLRTKAFRRNQEPVNDPLETPIMPPALKLREASRGCVLSAGLTVAVRLEFMAGPWS